MKKWSIAGLLPAIVSMAAVAVYAAPASGALTVCVKNSNGTLRAASAASACAGNETASELATTAEVATQAARITALETRVTALETDNTALKSRVSALEALLDGVSRSGNTLLFSGLNLQVVNGFSFTGTHNGVGNVIIGYNATFGADTRTGSHNLVIGDRHSYTSHAGIVSGLDNTLSGLNAFVAGGSGNTVDMSCGTQAETTRSSAAAQQHGQRSVLGRRRRLRQHRQRHQVVRRRRLREHRQRPPIVRGRRPEQHRQRTGFVRRRGHLQRRQRWRGVFGGGLRNTASGSPGFVGGGAGNTASGDWSIVGGGGGNTASGRGAFVGGGGTFAPPFGRGGNTANSPNSVVTGGSGNTAGSEAAFVGGGGGNTVSGAFGFVGGGQDKTAGTGLCAWLADVNLVPC